MLAAWFQQSHNSRLPLRVGVMLDALTVPRYAAQVIEDIAGSSVARIALVVLGPRHPAVPSDGAPASLLRLYEQFDRPPHPDNDPLEPVDVAGPLGHVETLRVETAATIARTNAATLAADVQRHQLDVLLSFTAIEPSGDVLGAATHGVWAFRFGGATPGAEAPDYFWDVREGRPLSSARLVRLGHPEERTTTLAECVVDTEPGLSVAANRPKPYWGSNTFVIQMLQVLHQRGGDVAGPRGPLAFDAIEGQAARRPTNTDVAGWIGPAIVRKAVHRLTHRGRVRHWQLAIRRGARPMPAGTGPPVTTDFTWIASPLGRFFADPFLLEHEQRTWVLFEDYDHVERRGRLSAAPIDGGSLGEVMPMLARPYHMSYPCVFRAGGDLFMVPETGGNGSVELYRCRKFPSDWVFERELFHGRAVDSTVWIEDGVFWFFVTVVEPRGHATQLWLFSADAIDAPWRLHPATPLSADVRNSRNAGAVFRLDGRLIRPSQDGSGRYGRRFGFNEITRLTPDGYAERPLVMVDPPTGFVGTHTYARSGEIEMIDGCVLLEPDDPRLSKPR